MHPETLTSSLPEADGSRILLQRGIRALGQLSATQYAGARDGHSSAGAQFRHILDHYAALFEGIGEGRVNYDARRRDRAIEHDPSAAALDAQRWIEALDQLDVAHGKRRVLVHSDSGGGPDCADWRESSIGRELQFLTSHTVHHYALIKLLLEWHGVSLDRDFGMAPSTRAHLAGTR
jgi:uncharacterized damage-inducible protein DinB